MKIGLISDTHGLLRPQAVAALQGCDHIIHAGDIGKPEILTALRQLAPLTVVYGNIDRDRDWAQHLRKVEIVKLKDFALLVTHERKDVPEPLPQGVQVVVTGHSHKPCIHKKDGVLYINPGSAGPRRFKLPISMGYVTCTAGKVSGQLIDLAPDTPVIA
ncbi:metallophosphatase family protein [Pseudomonas sp. LS1212]|uniref:metallophosphoesterase family protein n=1 Tax=Pseudomonas sp. LS1212 TaxID=2972478 RepID=UPI00215BCE5A|nr:metallophosphoesterase family protein [Pseudomonas sp. LS1212]UVJ43494.1 metallophosphatase family protein [Pseudomonas sp. LS1212]